MFFVSRAPVNEPAEKKLQKKDSHPKKEVMRQIAINQHSARTTLQSASSNHNNGAFSTQPSQCFREEKARRDRWPSSWCRPIRTPCWRRWGWLFVLWDVGPGLLVCHGVLIGFCAALAMNAFSYPLSFSTTLSISLFQAAPAPPAPKESAETAAKKVEHNRTLQHRNSSSTMT